MSTPLDTTKPDVQSTGVVDDKLQKFPRILHPCQTPSSTTSTFPTPLAVLCDQFPIFAGPIVSDQDVSDEVDLDVPDWYRVFLATGMIPGPFVAASTAAPTIQASPARHCRTQTRVFPPDPPVRRCHPDDDDELPDELWFAMESTGVYLP